jgi:hypothetical protein
MSCFNFLAVVGSLANPLAEVSESLDFLQDYSSSYNNLKLVFKRISSRPKSNDFDNDNLAKGEIYME